MKIIPEEDVHDIKSNKEEHQKNLRKKLFKIYLKSFCTRI